MEKVLRAETSRIASMMPLPDLLIPGIRDIPAVKYVVKERVKKGEYNALLFKAVKTGMIRIVEYLLDVGADIEMKEAPSFLGLLDFAVARNIPKMVELLLDRGANKEIKDRVGGTPLHTAVACNHIENVKLLVDAGAELNVEDNDRRTALFYAVKHGHTEIVDLLLELGGTVSASSLRELRRHRRSLQRRNVRRGISLE